MSESIINAYTEEGTVEEHKTTLSENQNVRSEYKTEHHLEHHHSSRHHSSQHHSHRYSTSSLGSIMNKQAFLNRFSSGKKHYSTSSNRHMLHSYRSMSRRFISILIILIIILSTFLYMISNSDRSEMLHDASKTPSEVDILKKENTELRNQIRELNKTIEEYKHKCGEN
ncbi:MAG: hypothetical protein PUB42_05075 [Firmicutes bacterium]|nr:hypothetical protein [Bacillota bacterium]